MRNWHELTWKETGESIRRGAVVILPVGSTEAHGPHLPLSTDVIISQEMSRRAAVKLKERDIEALVLPAIAYSVTDFSSDFPGTISIKKETAAFLIRDICQSVYKQGARLMVIANSHLEPEHVSSINDAIQAIKRETGREVVFPDKRKRRWAATLTDEFRRGDCHAGSYETSLILAARPDLVREEARKALPPVPISIADKIREGAATFKEAGGTEAYFGDPRAASREEGDAVYNALSEMIVTSVLEALEREVSAVSP
ncbi:MAG: creatininase [Blastocatellia bacterium AA13]|nr:MAG: creatininase [Blastocatellia bacterium AA13]